jgi:hypothetical protein
MQSKKKSLTESFINTLSGLFVGLAIQLLMYPTLGIEVNFKQNIILTFVFFLASVLRGYIIRRIFNKF